MKVNRLSRPRSCICVGSHLTMNFMPGTIQRYSIGAKDPSQSMGCAKALICSLFQSPTSTYFACCYASEGICNVLNTETGHYLI